MKLKRLKKAPTKPTSKTPPSDLNKKYGPQFTILWNKVFPYFKWFGETYPEFKKDYEGIVLGIRGIKGKQETNMAKFHTFP